MSEENPMINTWEKVLEYASSPLHGTMSRKLRKGVELEINGDTLFTDATIFISDTFVRFTETKENKAYNVYYDMNKIISIKTISAKD